MSSSASKLIAGCYCSEAMGFKVWKYNGDVLCCAEIVLQDYGQLPEEVTAWFALINKKTGKLNPYTLQEINAFGRSIGNKVLANADEIIAQQWIDNDYKEALKGARCYLHSFSKVLPSGFKLNTFNILPIGEYPSLDKTYENDDIDMGDSKEDVDADAKSFAKGLLFSDDGQVKVAPTISSRMSDEERKETFKDNGGNCPF